MLKNLKHFIFFLYFLFNFSLYSIDSADSFTLFSNEWNAFLHKTKFNKELIDQETEFSVLSIFCNNQLVRQRNSEEKVDRFIDCAPYRENALSLSDGTVMSASLIQMPDSHLGYHRFIASQAPNENNREWFWQMIEETQLDQIVMLTEFFENRDFELCYPYFPLELNETLSLKNGTKLTVIDKTSLGETEEYLEIRKILFEIGETKRVITHYWYRNWIDGTAPREITTLMNLIELVETEKMSHSDLDVPLLIHCAGGIGRTGVFITLYHLNQRKKMRHPIHLFDLVAYLRWQRPYMISRLCQYQFCYDQAAWMRN